MPSACAPHPVAKAGSRYDRAGLTDAASSSAGASATSSGRTTDPLGPLSTAKSARQKFQRAFAQEFLCPCTDLQAYIGTDKPGDDDIHAAARRFHVSERLIQTTLVNHHVIDRDSFAQMVEAA